VSRECVAIVRDHVDAFNRSGPDTEIPAAIVYSFDGGKVVRAEGRRDRAAALSAVGLGDQFQD
jgi:hypothetical protein